MGLFRRMRGLEASHEASSQMWTCPICGAVGLDDRAAEDSAVEPTFEIRGQDRGKPVRKCLVCGGGFLIAGRSAEAIPSARWEQMEAYFTEQMTRTAEEDEEFWRLHKQLLGDDSEP